MTNLDHAMPETGTLHQTLRESALHNEFVLCGKHAKDWIEKCKQMLPKIDQLQIWKKKGFESIFHYAATFAGMSRWAVTDALRVMRKAQPFPEIKQLIQDKGVNAARPIVSIATPANAGFLAHKARVMGKNTLETYLKERQKQENGGGDKLANRLELGTSTKSQPEKPLAMVAKMDGMELDPDVAAELLKLKGQGDWNSLMKELLELRWAKLEAEKPKPVKTDSRHIPTDIERWTVAKTRGQCGYPDCTKPYKILHHTQRWALEKIHDPDRIVPLCAAHERIAHQSLIENEDKPTNEWRVREEPVWWDYKFSIDQLVMGYRGA